MRDYELVTLLNPTLSQEGATASWERIKNQIKERGGQVLREDHWGTRRLSYTMRRASQKFTEGNFYFARFNIESKGATELENNLRLAEDVLRFLMTKATTPLPPPKAEAPAPAPQPVAAAAPAPVAAPQQPAPVAQVAPVSAEAPATDAPASSQTPATPDAGPSTTTK